MNLDGTQYLILDSVSGWREEVPASVREGLPTTPEGSRQLFAVPGRGSLLLKEDLQDKELVCPSSTAYDSSGILGVVDAATNRVSLIDLYRGTIQRIKSFGDKGSEPRNLRGPRGIAFLKSGGIVVADTGNHRVQIFSDLQYALLRSLGATDAQGNPAPGDGTNGFRSPWAVEVDGCDVCFIVDRGNHRIQKISKSGTWLEEIGRENLVDPIDLALGPDGLLAVADPGQQAVLLFSPKRAFPRSLTNIENLRSVAFGANGLLYVGRGDGLIEVYAKSQEAEKIDKYEPVGQGHSGIDGEIVDLIWVSDSPPFLLAIIKENTNGQRQRLWRVEPVGTFQHEGRFVTEALDSGIEKCQWHRVLLNASLPTTEPQSNGSRVVPNRLGACSIEIESYTSEQDVLTPLATWRECVLSGDNNPDCLIQSGQGRYLWLRLTMRSNGVVSPVLKSVKVFFPRASYLQYLPAVYQEDTESRLFLDRFLSIFQTQFDDFDQQINNLWQLFDPVSIDQKNFAWLAGWLALTIQPDSLIDSSCRFECVSEKKCQPLGPCDDPATNLPGPLEWSTEKKQQMLQDAFSSYLSRGTVPGLEKVIQDYTGVHFSKILEHFRLRRWPVLSVVAKSVESGTACDPPEEPAKVGSCGEELNDYKITLPLDGTVTLWSRDFYKRLQITSYSQIGYFRLIGTPEPILEPLDWGANRFTVFFPSSPYTVAETVQKVQNVVEREKPAHTQAELCPVLPRLRVGVQATIGTDAVVGGISHLVLNQLSTLNYDSILACSSEEQQLRSRGMTSRPRTGLTAKLL
jgi:hypothetical protein